jgi:hypothetical protein
MVPFSGAEDADRAEHVTNSKVQDGDGGGAEGMGGGGES